MLFNFGKTKKKRKENEPTIPEKWGQGTITAEEVIDYTSLAFVKSAMQFFESNQSIEAQIKKHNEENKEYQKRVDNIAAGADYPQKNLDLMLLKMHKMNKDEAKQNVVFRNEVDILGGYIQLECIRECITSRDDGTLDTSKETFLKYCMQEETVAKAMKEMDGKDIEYVSVTAEQMSWFYDVCRQYMLLSILEDEGKVNVSTSSMFNENGAVMLLDENNKFCLAEEDLLLRYDEIDYKGVV